ncbi:MAG: hypothetical protein KAR06_12400 [Deltaproteobacteria bacterium]|nr:hypothetical protein [Deltaproteobacteria bacterium]
MERIAGYFRDVLFFKRAFVVLLCAVGLSLLLFSGCGRSSDTPAVGSSNWEEMQWDDNNWG